MDKNSILIWTSESPYHFIAWRFYKKSCHVFLLQISKIEELCSCTFGAWVLILSFLQYRWYWEVENTKDKTGSARKHLFKEELPLSRKPIKNDLCPVFNPSTHVIELFFSKSVHLTYVHHLYLCCPFVPQAGHACVVTCSDASNREINRR